jgi:hypothetical protein
MLCDFSDSLEIVTFLNLPPHNVTNRVIPPAVPGYPPPQAPPQLEPPSGWHGSLQTDIATFYQAFVAGSWHDRAPGETRVRLDYTGLVTFYEPTLSSLVAARHGKDRLHHRLDSISPADTEHVLAELRSVLTRDRGSGSGIDWGSMVQVVTDRYAQRLEHLRVLLSPTAAATFTDAAEQGAAVRTQLLIMLVPYITTEDVPQRLPASTNTSWAAPVVRRCATTQTSLIPRGAPLTPQEVRIRAAVEGTLREICRRLTLVWLEFFDVEGEGGVRATEAMDVGRRHVEELMGWLDWSVWLRCEPRCSLGVGVALI